MGKKIKVITLIVDRANYGRLLPVMNEIENCEHIEQKVLCTGTTVLRRFGMVSDLIRAQKFDVLEDLFIEMEGSTHQNMAQSVGLATMLIAPILNRLKPDFLLVIGDRYETLGAVIAAAFQNIKIAHIQGGEISGSIDESTRHAITKFSHLHFTSTERSRNIVLRMGEDERFVHNTGCPVGDIIHNTDFSKIKCNHSIERLRKLKFCVVIFHPNTTNLDEAKYSVGKILKAINELIDDKSLDEALWLWPNIDAGADIIHVELRNYIAKSIDTKITFIKNLKPQEFQCVLNDAVLLIGNSSSFVRDASFMGTPVILYGDRQNGREISQSVRRMNIETDSMADIARQMLSLSEKQPSSLYGDGTASKKICELLLSLKPKVQKQFSL